ncbi:pentapeptide repeat-containing protein [Actinomadura sp. NBRC 104425]|nr:pentapeptide repeat-containing protein [Actinomadura sp. NBRC 104425]
MRGANLRGANLRGANLRGIRGMTADEVRQAARSDASTRF